VALIVEADWVVPVEGDPVRGGAVALDGERIAAVGPAGEIGAGFGETERVSLPGCVLAPGFVNLHTHIEYSAYAGFGDGLAFGPWIADHIRRKRRLQGDDAQSLALLGALACLRSGATTIVDASFSGDAVAAATQAGVRAVVALEVFGRTGEPAAVAADDLDARLAARAADAGPLVELGVSPHAPYSVPPELFEEVVRRARASSRRVVTHLAESRHELAMLLDGSGPLAEAMRAVENGVQPYGRHPILELHARGVLGPETVVAHAVHVGPEEIEALAESGCAVAHCPRSNALLGCGIAPVAELRAAGIPVGIGTDSPASALTLDLFEDLRAALLLSRARAEDAGALTTGDVLRLATLGGAEALGRGAELGALTPGRLADLVAVRLDDSTFWPADDPVNALVLGGAADRVALTIVSGAVRYLKEDGAYATALDRAATARARMLDVS
jgi:cytosine/adenosine deaminase-related metal-dependent hydrolase